MSTDKKKQVEQTLERYGVWVKAGPWEAEEEANFELMNIEDSEDGELPISEEEERLLGNLETAAHASESTGISEAHTKEGVDIHSKFPDEFHRIEDKLDSLKDEIRDLKNEISELSQSSAARIEDSEKSGGYFDDEDDETIALTDDELVHILDSADMTDRVVNTEKTVQSDSTAELDSPDAAAMDFTEVVEHEHSDDESIVNLDEIGKPSGEDEDFGEINDMGISETAITEDVIIEDLPAYQSEVGDSQASQDSYEAIEDEAFDEGEEVEIGLDEEEKDLRDESEVHDAAMEEVSLGDFGFDLQMDETTGTESDLTDTTRDIEELPDIGSLDAASVVEDVGLTVDSDSSSESEARDIELSDVGVGDMMSDGAELVLSGEEETVHTDIKPPDELDVIDEEETVSALDEADELDVIDEEGVERVEVLDEADELDVIDVEGAGESADVLDEADELDAIGEEERAGALDEADELDAIDEEGVGERTEALDEADELDAIDEEERAGVLDEADELDAIDEEERAGVLDEADDLDAIDEEETAETLDEADKPDVIDEKETVEILDELDVTELDDEEFDTSDVVVDRSVSPPKDTYKELPGTEEVNLDSLEALASDTKTTEVEEPEALSDIESEEVEASTISNELKEEIRNVLKYMDQLLLSLPEKKVREFRKSEHFERYKKIFEELGISK